MTSELKPCPFCHRTKYLKIKNSYCVEFDSYYGFEVICDASGFKGHERGCGSAGAWGETEECAATVWNTRAVPDVPELVRYRLNSLGELVYSENGSYVLHSQAAEIIAAKDAEIYCKDNALRFYADISKYPAPLTGGMGALWEDCGQIARDALGETK